MSEYIITMSSLQRNVHMSASQKELHNRLYMSYQIVQRVHNIISVTHDP